MELCSYQPVHLGYYEIEVKNPNHVCKGVTSLTVDGNAVDGNVIPVAGDGGTHKVVVTLG